MTRLYRAKVEFSYVADAASLKKLKASRETDDPAEKLALQAQVKRVTHGPKDKPFEAPSDEIAKSWLANGVAEEVTNGEVLK